MDRGRGRHRRQEEGSLYWMVALLALDGRQYVYRVYAPPQALRGDVFWAAFHCHDEGPHPRASDWFDSAVLWRLGPVDRV